MRYLLFLFLTPLLAQWRISVVAGGYQAEERRADQIWMTPQDMVQDAIGNLYVADLQSVYRITPEGIATIVAGAGPYSSGEGGARAANLDTITGLAVDAAGTVLYVAEGTRDRVRKIDLVGGGIETVAVDVKRPGGLALAADGGLYIADQGRYVVRRLGPAGDMSIVAGSGEAGGSGDGGPAVEARLSPMFAVSIDGAGNLLIADTLNRRIRRLDPSGRIDTLATGELRYPTRAFGDRQGRIIISDAALGRVLVFDPETRTSELLFGLRFPVAVLDDPLGRIVVADQGANRLVRIDRTAFTHDWFAGAPQDGDGGPGLESRLATPLAIAASPAGDIVFSDEIAHKVRAVSGDTGAISTVLGDGTPGLFGLPKALTIDRRGDLYLLDGVGNRILRRRNGELAFAIIGSRIRPGDGIASDGEGNVYYAFQHAIYRIDASGRQERIAASTLFEGIIGLALDASGALYVAERDADRIRKVDVNSHEVSPFASDLSGPAGLAFDTDGNLWVAESKGARLTRISPSGERFSVTGPFQFPAYLTWWNGAVFFTDLRDNRVYKAEP